MSSILTFLSRQSTQKVKVDYTFTIKTLFADIANADNVEIGDQISISVERGKKHIDSSDGAVKRLDSARIGVEYNDEALHLPATLYKKKKTGSYNEKAALIRIRQRRKGTVGLKNTPDAFKTIGVVPVQLQSILNCDGVKIAFPLKFCMIEGMKLEVLINIKMDKSTESVATGSEISTTNNNNDSSNNTNDDNNDDEESTIPTSHNLQISLTKPDQHNTPIKEPLVVSTRNSPSPEVTKWKDLDAPNNNIKSSPVSNVNTNDTNNDDFNWDEAFNSNTNTPNQHAEVFSNFSTNNNNNNNDDDDDNYDNKKIKSSLQNIEKSVVSLDNVLGSTDSSFAPSLSPASPSSSSSSSADKIKQLELLLKITTDERDSAIRTRAHLEGLLKEKEKENQGLLQKLIETRVELVSSTTKLETSKCEHAKYKNRCSMYASRICKLEVSLVEATLQAESPRTRASSKSINSSTPLSSKIKSPTSPTNPFE